MSGECKSYKLNSPMTWDEFKELPDDIKVMYIKLLRQKFNVSVRNIAFMMGADPSTLGREVRRIGLGEGKYSRGKSTQWDKEGFYAWASGADKLPAPVPEENPMDKLMGRISALEEAEKNLFGEEKGYVEDDLPFEEPDLVPVDEARALRIQISELLKANEELKAVHEKDKQENAWLRNECDRYRRNNQMLEAQMEVVRMIFGGKNHD